MPEVFWIESVWKVPVGGADELAARLEGFGSLGGYEQIALDRAETDARSAGEFIAYFPDACDTEGLRRRLEGLSGKEAALVSLRRIPREDWAEEWKKFFKPFAIAPGIVIRPSWEDYAARPGERVLTLDPGMAFGTGQHDTTRLCAELILELKREQTRPLSLLDVGCGSGILALIARLGGFAEAAGTDTDPAAIETSLENLARNPLAAPADFRLTDGSLEESWLVPHDVVAANIIAETLCALSGRLTALVKPGGYLILSGILADREDEVKKVFAGLELCREMTSPEWHAYVYRQGQ